MWQHIGRFKKDKCSETRALLSGYLDQRLSPAETARVKDHLGACQGCRDDLESLRATVSLLRGLPEMTPASSFAVAPVRPLPWRTALPALRFATAGVVLLLVVAFTVDQTNALDREDSGGMYSTAAVGNGAYWTVAGVKNDVDADSQAPAELVVPDGSDNVVEAVNSLAAANNGVLVGNVEYSTDEVSQIILVEGVEGAPDVPVQVYYFVDQATDNVYKDTISMNGSASITAARAQDGWYLNMSSSDNAVSYSFNLDDAQPREVKPAEDDGWLRGLEYGLAGLAAVLGGVAAVLWLKQRRAKALEATESRS